MVFGATYGSVIRGEPLAVLGGRHGAGMDTSLIGAFGLNSTFYEVPGRVSEHRTGKQETGCVPTANEKFRLCNRSLCPQDCGAQGCGVSTAEP